MTFYLSCKIQLWLGGSNGASLLQMTRSAAFANPYMVCYYFELCLTIKFFWTFPDIVNANARANMFCLQSYNAGVSTVEFRMFLLHDCRNTQIESY